MSPESIRDMLRYNDTVRVMMIGPSPEVQGGVSYVIRLMLNHAPERLTYEVIPTIVPRTTAEHLHGKYCIYFLKVCSNLSDFAVRLSSMRRAVRTKAFELAHIHFSAYGSTLRKYLVARLLDKHQLPFIFHAHAGNYREFYQHAPAFVKQRILWMLRASSGLIVLSEQLRAFYEELLRDCSCPIWVMPNPVELPHYQEPDASDMLKLLFLGRMGKHKGTDRILQAVARLPTHLSAQVRLYMAGDGDVDAMRQLAAELGLNNQVDIRNWIEGEDKRRWLQETNAFILPSRSEGLPMAMLEAMAWSKALIVSPVGGIPEFVTDRQEGILVPPEDIEAISQAIATLAQNPEQRVQMGRAARARVEPLDVRKYMERMVKIYREVLEGCSNRSE